MSDKSSIKSCIGSEDMTLVQMLAVKRMALGMSQDSFGQRVGVSSTCVSQWERGIRRPRAELVPGVAAVLRVDPELLARLIVDAQR